MLNLSKQEKSAIIILVLIGLAGSGAIAYKNRREKINITVNNFETRTDSLDGIESQIRQAKTVDINTATAEDLQSLRGIGPSLAQEIVEYRVINGPFKKIEEIQNVSGIGPNKFGGIREFLKIE